LHRFDDNGVAADPRIGAHGKAAQHFCAGANDHAGFQCRVPFGAFIERCATQSDALIDGAVIPNFSSFTNRHAKAVIDKHTPANQRAGVNFNARERARNVR
jgi:hypothetical protein